MRRAPRRYEPLIREGEWGNVLFIAIAVVECLLVLVGVLGLLQPSAVFESGKTAEDEILARLAPFILAGGIAVMALVTAAGLRGKGG